MWWLSTYEPVSLISLKASSATSTGGKSLLLPTPFALKMALLNVVIQANGVQEGERIWPVIRDGEIAVAGPSRIVVNNTFTKILKPSRGKPTTNPDTGIVEVMSRTIGFREFVQWTSQVKFAFAPSADGDTNWSDLMSQIHYLGKRGGFVQATGNSATADELPQEFLLLSRENTDSFRLDGTLQMMDDCGSDLNFDKVNIYTSKNIRLGTDRILRPIILPYRVARSSRGYTLYERLD